MSKFWIAAAAALMTATPALAQPYAATGVDITGAAARLTVIAEDRGDVSIDVTAGARLAAPAVRLDGGRVVIDGGLNNRLRGCRSIGLAGPAQTTVQVTGVGWVRVDELPQITMRVPRTLDLTSRGTVFATIGASNGGRVRLGGCGDATIARVNGPLDLTMMGSGDIDVGEVTGALRAQLDGSGDLTIAAALAGADLKLRGSGDLDLERIAGPLVADLDGSGDIRVGPGASEAQLSLQGSGDVVTGAVRGPLSARADGSGNVTVASVAGGPVQLALVGSGDVAVRGGTASRLNVRLDGSGDVDFDGEVGQVEADIGGSGDVSVRRAGSTVVRKRGSGELHVGS